MEQAALIAWDCHPSFNGFSTENLMTLFVGESWLGQTRNLLPSCHPTSL